MNLNQTEKRYYENIVESVSISASHVEKYFKVLF